MEFGLFDGGENDEHNDTCFISEIYNLQHKKFSLELSCLTEQRIPLLEGFCEGVCRGAPDTSA